MIINDDCLKKMSKMESNSISAIITDPPYGLKFMGKDWDHGIPGIIIWEEALRICKPGSFLLSFGGTRTFHRLTCAIEDAGWQIRDCIVWLYGSGFPKSHNKFGIEGYGTALKPAWEPIIMAMKPCDGTFKQNAEIWEQAGINIDDCRIGMAGCTKRLNQPSDPKNAEYKGRWPANILLDENVSTLLGAPSRFFYCAKANSNERDEGCEDLPVRENPFEKDLKYMNDLRMENEQKRLPRKNDHPTVKPLKLMEYLIKLIMPPKDGILLDPFAGSGTTILAGQNLGYKVIGIEKDEGYCEIARQRCKQRIKE